MGEDYLGYYQQTNSEFTEALLQQHQNTLQSMTDGQSLNSGNYRNANLNKGLCKEIS